MRMHPYAFIILCIRHTSVATYTYASITHSNVNIVNTVSPKSQKHNNKKKKKNTNAKINVAIGNTKTLRVQPDIQNRLNVRKTHTVRYDANWYSEYCLTSAQEDVTETLPIQGTLQQWVHTALQSKKKSLEKTTGAQVLCEIAVTGLTNRYAIAIGNNNSQ